MWLWSWVNLQLFRKCLLWMVVPVTKQLSLSSKSPFCTCFVMLKLEHCKPYFYSPADSLLDSTTAGRGRRLKLEKKTGTLPFCVLPVGFLSTLSSLSITLAMLLHWAAAGSSSLGISSWVQSALFQHPWNEPHWVIITVTTINEQSPNLWGSGPSHLGSLP